MTPSQVCKHQVCDYCSGRFGMVTHRWWGNKFCKRTCKNAYFRENDRTLSGWIIPRFLFAGGACLAAALAVSVLTLLLLASANAAPSEGQPAAGVSLEFNKEERAKSGDGLFFSGRTGAMKFAKGAINTGE